MLKQILSVPKGPIAPKFAGGEKKCRGLPAAYEEVADNLGCHYFDANLITGASKVDGVHLDEPQHKILGEKLAAEVIRVIG